MKYCHDGDESLQLGRRAAAKLVHLQNHLDRCAPGSAQLAIISSDDSLRFLDSSSLKVNGVVKKANSSITCLERANDAPSNIVATAGRDGLIRYWDQRTREKALEIQSRTFLADGVD